MVLFALLGFGLTSLAVDSGPNAGKSAKISVLGATKNLGRETLVLAGSLGIVSFQKDRQPLRSRMTAIDGPGFHEYHDAQPATLLTSAMWVSLSLGVSAPGWGVFVGLFGLFCYTKTFRSLPAIPCRTPSPPIMRGWKYLVASCVDQVAELEQTLVANMFKEKTLFSVVKQGAVMSQRTRKLLTPGPRHQPAQVVLLLHRRQDAAELEPQVPPSIAPGTQ